MVKLKNINITEFKNFKWYNITKNTKKEISFIEKNFKTFHQDDIDNCLPPLQRPKILKYPDYIFMILLFPYYDRKTKEVKVSEIDFFIGHNFIITVHDNKLQPLIDKLAKYHSKDNTDYDFNIKPIDFLYETIHDLLEYCFPMLNHVGLDVDEIQQNIFDEVGKENIRDILMIKRNIINFRKSMQAHKNVLKKLTKYSTNLFENDRIGIYFENLIEKTRDIWDLLDNFKETVNALYHSNESLVSLRLSEIMKMLTIISVLTFPLTLFAALFSTNVSGTPFTNNPFGFWILLSFMFFVAIGMLYTFKSKRWL